jgi:hypothetical protein
MIISDNAKKKRTWLNAIQRRYGRKSVSIIHKEKNDSFLISIKSLASETINPKLPSVHHENIEDKISVNSICLTRETLEAIIISGIELLEKLEKNERNKI